MLQAYVAIQRDKVLAAVAIAAVCMLVSLKAAPYAAAASSAGVNSLLVLTSQYGKR